jgi:hypothetical protein
MIVLDFIYYRFYRVSKWIALREPETSPIFLLPFLLFTDAVYIAWYYGVKFPHFSHDYLAVLLIYVSMVIIFYLIFGRKKRYLKIIERFKNESKKWDIILNIVALIYIAITMEGILVIMIFK